MDKITKESCVRVKRKARTKGKSVFEELAEEEAEKELLEKNRRKTERGGIGGKREKNL